LQHRRARKSSCGFNSYEIAPPGAFGAVSGGLFLRSDERGISLAPPPPSGGGGFFCVRWNLSRAAAAFGRRRLFLRYEERGISLAPPPPSGGGGFFCVRMNVESLACGISQQLVAAALDALVRALLEWRLLPLGALLLLQLPLLRPRLLLLPLAPA